MAKLRGRATVKSRRTTKWIKETRDSLYENASLTSSDPVYCLALRRGGMEILITRYIARCRFIALTRRISLTKRTLRCVFLRVGETEMGCRR